MRRLPALLILAFAIATAACAANKAADGTSTRSRRADPSVLDSSQLRNGNFSTVYDAIRQLHADWLLPRGGPSGGRVPELGVFVEGQMRNRGVTYLQSLRPIDIIKVRRLSITESTNSYSWPWGGLVITARY
jgi:hypothetical protein